MGRRKANFMAKETKPIRAAKEVIWHLTCGECGNYWTYPTMQTDQDIGKMQLHCPLCGQKSHVEPAPPPS
jgi:transcription elongation factor Elf1